MVELFTQVAALLIRLFPTIPVFIGFAATIFELDPFFFVFKAYLPDQMFCNHQLKIVLLRFILSATCVFEFLWIVAFMYVAANGTVDVIFTIMGKLTYGKLSFEFTFRIYSITHVVLRSAQRLTDFAAGLLITALMGATIIALYLSISGYTLIPASIYWIFPCISFVTVSSLEIILIPFIYVYEGSTVIILKLKITPVNIPKFKVGISYNLWKLMHMRISTMRPFVFYVGVYDYRFQKLCEHTKGAIIEKISSFTISALLAKRSKGLL